MSRARDLANRTIASAALPKAGGTMTGNIVMGDDTSIGIGDALERIEFDGAGDITLLGCNVGIGTATPAAVTASVNLQLGDTFLFQDVGGLQGMVSNNAHLDTTWKRVTEAPASAMRLLNGNFSFHCSPTGVAGSALPNWDGTDVKMIILESGYVGIGILAPTSALHVLRNADNDQSLTVDTVNDVDSTMGFSKQGTGYWRIGRTNSTGNFDIMTEAGTRVIKAASAGDVYNGNDSTVWQTSSDERIKTNISTLSTSSLDKINQLRPVAFEYTAEFKEENSWGEKQRYGFIAQEYKVVFPEAVSLYTRTIDDVDVDDFHSLDVGDLTAHLVASIQVLDTKVTTLESANTALEARVLALESA